MKIEQTKWSPDVGWVDGRAPGDLGATADLVFVFGAASLLPGCEGLSDLRSAYPEAELIGCSTAGEIFDTTVSDDSLVATAVHFERTSVVTEFATLASAQESRACGEELARRFETDGLRHVFMLSKGVDVNGSELVAGLMAGLPDGVTVTGGLSADGPRFERTFVLREGEAVDDAVACVGFYGETFRVGYGSVGGWDPFGPERLITRSEDNVLYEFDGQSALELYKTYLGEHAAGLPATGLLFPLALRTSPDSEPVVRTILGVDEEQKSMTFAGDVPVGGYARLMKANFDRLIDGATDAARTSATGLRDSQADLAILISCVGRKMVLKQRVEEEVEGVRDILGDEVVMTGFYSYGEVSPFAALAKCELHNQTMTVTTLSE